MSRTGNSELQGEDRVMLVKVDKTAGSAPSPEELYEAARNWWNASLVQAQLAQRVLAVVNNTVVAAYEPVTWEVSHDPETYGKVGFRGVEASDGPRFVGRSVAHLFPRGAANPVRYTTVAVVAPDDEPSAPPFTTSDASGPLHLLLRIRRSWQAGMSPDDLYDATRGYWMMSPTRAESVDRVHAVVDGVVREVYEPASWAPSSTPGEEHRIGFEGAVAGDAARWRGLDVSAVFPHGSQNPVRYVPEALLQELERTPVESDERPPSIPGSSEQSSPTAPATGPDLTEQLTPLLSALSSDLLWSMSRAGQELFHSNTLAWLLAEHPRTMGPLRAALGSPGSGPLDVWREWRNLDLVASGPDDTGRLVVENKLYSIPYPEQLRRYTGKPLPWSKEHGGDGADGTDYVLLSLMEPNFALPQPWRRVGYEDVLEGLDRIEAEVLGRDAVLFDRYRTLLRRLLDLKTLVDPRSDVEGPFSVKQVVSKLGLKWFAGPLQRMRFTGLAQMIADEYGAPLSLSVDLTRSMGLVTYVRRLSDQRAVGWQLQEGQLRLFVLIQDEGLTGPGKRLAAARAEVAEAEYRDFADFGTVERVLGTLLKPSGLQDGEWRRFAPDFVYRYRKIDDSVSSQVLAEALAELTAYVGAWR